MNRKLINTLMVALLTVWATANTFAVPVNITNDGTSLVGDVGKNSNLGDNSPATSFDWLAGENGFPGIVPDYNTITGSSLPAPVEAGFFAADVPENGPTSFDVTGYVYAVLHYGTGKGGTKGEGGGIVAYYLNGLTGSYAFPANGLGPNGYGGLSSVRLFGGNDVSVPDGGATAALLGLGFLGLAAISRKRS